MRHLTLPPHRTRLGRLGSRPLQPFRIAGGLKPVEREEVLSTSQHRASLASAQNALTFRNVLFAADFTAASNNAWWYALALASHFRSKLIVAHVLSPTAYVSVPPELLGEAKNRAMLEAKARMAQLQQRQRGATRLESEALLREGDIAEVLLGLVPEHNIDLVVVATRGHRHLK